jgi:cobaltochelatase CobN
VSAAQAVLDARERRATEIHSAILTLADSLSSVRQHEQALRDSPAAEVTSILNALNGGYVAPQSGGDPIASPAAVPTGRNLFGVDAEKTPSPQAWTIGVGLADSLLARHVKQHGRYPRKVAFSFWAGDFIATEGALVAQTLYLLGVEPVRNPLNSVVDVRLIPMDRLKRPRIDVVVQTSGQLRDIAASRLYLINKAVRLAAEADDGENYVRGGVVKAEEVMKTKGLSPVEARELSTMRVFGGVNGNYGSQIMELVEKGDGWETEADVATRYLANMGAMYDEGGRWSEYKEGVFEAALQDTEVVVNPRQSNTWGALSLDHVYEFMGGLSMAARHVTGKDPDAYFNDFRNAQRPKVTELKETIWTEARTTLLNPAYLRDLTAGGASSAEKFAETFRNTYGWNVMKPAAIDQSLWDSLHATYVEDVHKLGVQEFFRRENPYAMQEITAVMMETARKGYWKATDQQLRALATIHVNLMKEFKAGCSEFVCDNPRLRETVAKYLDAGDVQAYQQQIAQVIQAGGQNSNVVLRPEQATRSQVSRRGLALAYGPTIVMTTIAAMALVLAAFVWRKRRPDLRG